SSARNRGAGIAGERPRSRAQFRFVDRARARRHRGRPQRAWKRDCIRREAAPELRGLRCRKPGTERTRKARLNRGAGEKACPQSAEGVLAHGGGVPTPHVVPTRAHDPHWSLTERYVISHPDPKTLERN